MDTPNNQFTRMMTTHKFTKSLYCWLFFLALGLEIVVDTLFAIRPDHEQHPWMHFLGGAMGIVVVITIAIGGILLVYNPQLNRYPDPPTSLNLNGPNDSAVANADISEQDQGGDWPEWKPVALCVVALTIGLAIFAYLIADGSPVHSPTAAAEAADSNHMRDLACPTPLRHDLPPAGS